MATEWIKLRSGLDNLPKVWRIAKSVDLESETVVFHLYRLAGWFQQYGKYGKLKADLRTVNSFLRVPGFAEALRDVDWLRDHDGVLMLNGFCSVSTARKSLGKEVRRRVLEGASCAACGVTEDLVVDHVVPVVRGGSCEEENLQALCDPCNRAKGRKTMEEFLRGRHA